MSYQVIRDQNDVPKLILSGEPAYCHVLAANATTPEPDIRAGQWLLMAFAVWSVPDVAAVQAALDLARSLDGELNLGLRPYDDTDELRGCAQASRWTAMARSGFCCVTVQSADIRPAFSPPMS